MNLTTPLKDGYYLANKLRINTVMHSTDTFITYSATSDLSEVIVSEYFPNVLVKRTTKQEVNAVTSSNSVFFQQQKKDILFIIRIIQEIGTVSSIPTIEVYEKNNTVYIRYLIAGTTLDHLSKNNSSRILASFEQIIMSLKRLHEKNILHGNISKSNIIISSNEFYLIGLENAQILNDPKTPNINPQKDIYDICQIMFSLMSPHTIIPNAISQIIKQENNNKINTMAQLYNNLYILRKKRKTAVIAISLLICSLFIVYILTSLTDRQPPTLEERLISSIKYQKEARGIVINGFDNSKYEQTHFDIPPTIDNIPVVKIVSMSSNVTHISLPEGLIEIGAETFKNCVYLEEIHIPSTVQTIGKDAFQNCRSLKSVHISDENQYFYSNSTGIFSYDHGLIFAFTY